MAHANRPANWVHEWETLLNTLPWFRIELDGHGVTFPTDAQVPFDQVPVLLFASRSTTETEGSGSPMRDSLLSTPEQVLTAGITSGAIRVAPLTAMDYLQWIGDSAPWQPEDVRRYLGLKQPAYTDAMWRMEAILGLTAFMAAWSRVIAWNRMPLTSAAWDMCRHFRKMEG